MLRNDEVIAEIQPIPPDLGDVRSTLTHDQTSVVASLEEATLAAAERYKATLAAQGPPTEPTDIIQGSDPGDENGAQVAQPGPPSRFEEWHLTVEGVHPSAWDQICRQEGIKALFIELSNGDLQLMCACDWDPTETIQEYLLGMGGDAKIVRTKHEVSELREGEVALYYEAHLKFDGHYRADLATASRELYRMGHRWYLTKRHPKKPIDLIDFGERGRALSWGKGSTMVGGEAEIVVLDTNPGLDGNWCQ